MGRAVLLPFYVCGPSSLLRSYAVAIACGNRNWFYVCGNRFFGEGCGKKVVCLIFLVFQVI